MRILSKKKQRRKDKTKSDTVNKDFQLKKSENNTLQDATKIDKYQSKYKGIEVPM